jgi:hypothetical protein
VSLRDRVRTWLLAEPAAPNRALLQSYIGATGTRFTGSSLQNEEYSSALRGTKWAAICEKMRRESMVRATLNLINLPVRAAQWSVECEDEKVKAFVEELLFKRLDWQQYLHHCLLAWPFGYEVMEKVWELDGGKWWYADLEHRGQATINNWFTDDRGRLAGIEQRVWKGSLYTTARIPEVGSPMDARFKLVHLAWDQDGTNFEGLPGLRSAYPYWFAKMEVFRIAAMALERFGMGIPEGEPPVDPVTGLPRFTPDDKSAAETMLKAIRAGSQAYIWNPGGWKFTIKGADGTTRYDPMPFLQYCDEMIALNALAESLNLGRTQTGSRAVGETQMDTFMLSLEAICQLIAETTNKQVIAPALELNFPNADKIECTIQWADLEPQNPAAVAAFLAKLGADGHITPDDELEGHLRDLADLPALPEELRRDAQPEPAAPPPVAAPAQLPPDDEAAKDDQVVEDDEEQPPPKGKQKAHDHGFHGRLAVSGKAKGYWRPLRPEEETVALTEIAGRQDDDREEIAAVFRQVRRSWIEDLGDQLRRAAADGDYSDVDEVEVSRELIKPAQKLIVATLRDLYRYGRQTVRDELKRQQRRAALPGVPDQAPVMRDDSADSAELNDLFWTRSGKYLRRLSRAVEEQAIEQAMGGLRTRGPADLDIDDVVRKVSDALDEGLFEATARLEAQVLVGEALNLGRDAEAGAAAELVDHAVYTAILDENVCDECADQDGEEFEVGTPEYYDATPPNTDCESTASGSNYCRCMWIYVLVSQTEARG